MLSVSYPEEKKGILTLLCIYVNSLMFSFTSENELIILKIFLIIYRSVNT